MRPVLTLKPQQRLSLTPALQQSLRILRCSVPELEQEIARAMSENPWLVPTTALPVEPSSLFPSDDTVTDAWCDDQPYNGTLENVMSERCDRTGEAWVSTPSLREHLLTQLQCSRMDDQERALVMLLIDELDDNGYLAASLEEIAQSLPEGVRVPKALWASALARLQSLEPAGVGARNLRECLQLQILRCEDVPVDICACASELAEGHLQALASGRLDALARRLGVAPDLLAQARALLLRLDPKPGRAWSQTVAPWVVPEVIVRQQGNVWCAWLNPAALPRLGLAETIEAASDTVTLHQQRRQALGLLGQLRQRYDTLLRVARQVVSCQQAYFRKGPRAMRPLVLREVARALGMHESTVSRATRQKYVQMPREVRELRSFFAPPVAPDSPRPMCAEAVRARLREWVRRETPDRPLTDDALARRLARLGMPVARRTVAKYREAEGIPNAWRRRHTA